MCLLMFRLFWEGLSQIAQLAMAVAILTILEPCQDMIVYVKSNLKLLVFVFFFLVEEVGVT